MAAAPKPKPPPQATDALLSAGAAVYAVNREKGWLRGKVAGPTAADPTQKLDICFEGESAATVGIPRLQVHPYLPNAFNAQDPDLFRVEDLHISTLLYCLKERYEGLRTQYSRMGGMILSVNPFARMPFNDDAERQKYLSLPTKDSMDVALPPHVWAIADKAYKEVVVRATGNQSVVISGESGSGKTENTKAVIGYLGEVSLKHSCNPVQRATVQRINERLRSSNPILEAFGNARTVRNDNSSRFGKYIKLFFEGQSGIMVGGEMVTYLLEKSRICSIAQGERNYHVFYDMLAGLSPQQKLELGGLKSAQDYPCLAGGGQLTRRGTDGSPVNDAQEFTELQESMALMGLSRERQGAIWSVLAALLHLSLVTFVARPSDEKASIADVVPLQQACKVLGLDAAELSNCFLEKSRSALMTSLATVSEAEALRDSFCKCLYVGLFDYVVMIVNQAIACDPQVLPAGGSSSSSDGSGSGGGRAAPQHSYVGILDIFGFENFAKNSFEQLCINFANEALQNQYNKFTFTNDQEECKAEGIACPDVVAPDNAVCVSLIEDTRRGLFAFLDDQCYSRGGTTAAFTSNAWEALKDNPCFVRPKSTVPNAFSVKHYAAEVHYNTDGWLAKNSDPLRDEARACLRKTAHPDKEFVGALLDGAETVGSAMSSVPGQPPKKRSSVSSRFREQLRSLRSELESTTPNYIRCVKPNPLAKPAVLDNAHVTSQLESAGVLQTIALKRQGYPVRRSHEMFAKYFHGIAKAAEMRRLMTAKQYREASNNILTLYTTKVFAGKWLPVVPWAIGHGKVFTKADCWALLERTLLRRNKLRVRRCVPHLKKWIARFRKRKQEELERKKAKELAEAKQKRVSGGAILTEDQMKWFHELALVFHRLDCEVVYDVVGSFRSRELAVAAIARILEQQWDKNLPANLVRVLRDLSLSPKVCTVLSERAIDTVSKLFSLSQPQQAEIGFTAAEQQRLATLIVQQESECLRNERMKASGTGEVSAEELTQLFELAVAAREKPVARNEAAAQLAETIACSYEIAEEALKQAKGNSSQAAALILDGRVSLPSTPAAAPPASVARPPPPSAASVPRAGPAGAPAAGPPPPRHPRPGDEVPFGIDGADRAAGGAPRPPGPAHHGTAAPQVLNPGSTPLPRQHAGGPPGYYAGPPPAAPYGAPQPPPPFAGTPQYGSAPQLYGTPQPHPPMGYGGTPQYGTPQPSPPVHYGGAPQYGAPQPPPPMGYGAPPPAGYYGYPPQGGGHLPPPPQGGHSGVPVGRPVQLPPSRTAAPAFAQPVDQAKVKRITDMGFTAEQATQALSACGATSNVP